MSRTKKFMYNSLSTAIYQIVMMIAGLIIPRIMLKYYGSEINGLVSSINQFIVYFFLVEAGLSGAAIYALYKPLAENDQKKINGVVSAAKKFYIQSGYIFMILTIGLAFLYPLFVDTNVLKPIDIGLLVIIIGMNGVLEFFTLAKYRVLLTADQKIYVISLASMIHLLVNTIIVIILGKMQVDIVVLRLVALFSIFLRSFILMIYVKRKYKFLDYNEKPNISALNKRWDALYLQILGALHRGAPIVILTVVTRNLKIVSVFTVYNMVLISINGILGVFKSGLSSSFGDVIARGEKSTLQKSYSEFELSFYALIAAMYAITFIMLMPFIRIYTNGINDINYDVPLLGFLFVLNGLLYNLKTPQGMLVMSAGMFRETRLQSTIQGAIVIFLGIILTVFYGIYGILIASIVSNLYRDIDLLFFIPNNLTHLPVIETAKRMFRVGITVIIIWIPFIYIDIRTDGYLEWVSFSVLVSIYAILVVLIMSILFDKVTFNNLYKRLVRMVRK